MDASSAFTTYDFVIFGIFIILVVRGMWVGFISQISALVALYLGYFIASQYHTELFPFMEKISTSPKVIFLSSYALAFLISYVVIMLIGKVLTMMMVVSVAGVFDRFLGGLVGAIKAVIVVVTMHLLLGVILAPENSTIRDCASCEIVTDVSEFARELIKDPEARKALMAQEPAISLDKVKEYLEPIPASPQNPPAPN